MGPMGFSVGAVIGARLARPDAVCIAFTGDGAFMMQGAEISTAQRNNIGAIWIVLQDNDLAMVTQGMGVAAKANPSVANDPAVWQKMFSLGSPDLVQYATGLGAQACLVHDPAEFRTALLAAIEGAAAGRPQAIIAAVDKTVIPPYYTPLYTPPKA
jgi:acetolactate synthase-1/2/3 large subunit